MASHVGGAFGLPFDIATIPESIADSLDDRLDGGFLSTPEIEDLSPCLLAGGEAEQTSDGIGDVHEIAGLHTVTLDHWRFSGENTLDGDRHDCRQRPVVLTRAVVVERPDRDPAIGRAAGRARGGT